jgi:hypothetical protein
MHFCNIYNLCMKPVYFMYLRIAATNLERIIGSLVLYWRIILKWALKKLISSARIKPSCLHANELSSFIKRGQFLGYLTEISELNQVCAQRNDTTRQSCLFPFFFFFFFLAVRATTGKFGLHVGNMKFNTSEN